MLRRSKCQLSSLEPFSGEGGGEVLLAVSSRGAPEEG